MDRQYEKEAARAAGGRDTMLNTSRAQLERWEALAWSSFEEAFSMLQFLRMARRELHEQPDQESAKEEL